MKAFTIYFIGTDPKFGLLVQAKTMKEAKAIFAAKEGISANSMYIKAKRGV